MDTKQKYVRLKLYNSIIIFPCVIKHDEFKKFEPISAGFCYVNAERQRVDCFGESISLGLKADKEKDTVQATLQIFGINAALNIK